METHKIIPKPKNLRENQKIQNKLFEDLCYGEQKQKFYYYIGTHPRLFDGLDIDSATIQYLIEYFYDYDLRPNHFERHFVNSLRRILPVYNNMKAVEFNKRIFDITTNQSVRDLVANATNELKRDGTLSSIQNDTGTITDSGSVVDTGTITDNGEVKETGTITDNGEVNESGSVSDNGTITENGRTTNNENITTETDTTNKNANRKLPMQSTGDDFEDIVNWDKGASEIAQTENDVIEDQTKTQNATLNNTKNITNTTTTTNNTDSENTRTLDTNKENDNVRTLDTNKETNNVRTLGTKIDKNDINSLTELATKENKDKTKYKAVNGQAVMLIKRIWDYLLEPKSLDYITTQLEECFILVY